LNSYKQLDSLLCLSVVLHVPNQSHRYKHRETDAQLILIGPIFSTKRLASFKYFSISLSFRSMSWAAGATEGSPNSPCRSATPNRSERRRFPVGRHRRAASNWIGLLLPVIVVARWVTGCGPGWVLQDFGYPGVALGCADQRSWHPHERGARLRQDPPVEVERDAGRPSRRGQPTWGKTKWLSRPMQSPSEQPPHNDDYKCRLQDKAYYGLQRADHLSGQRQ
jgi:hypothetical protein